MLTDRLFVSFPLGTIDFFRKVIIFSAVGGALLCAPIVPLLFHTQHSTLHCDYVLRSYHATRLVLFLLQLPLRAYLLRELIQAKSRSDRAAVVEECKRLCKSRVWTINQSLGVLLYWTFAFAAVFIIRAPHCSSSALSASPWLYHWAVVSVVMFVVHMAVSGLWLRAIVSEDAFEAAIWKRGANAAIIESTTERIVYRHANSADAGSNRGCPICQCDEYEDGDVLRRLRCRHAFHTECVDSWLARKKSCPLCQRNIDEHTAPTAVGAAAAGGISDDDNGYDHAHLQSLRRRGG